MRQRVKRLQRHAPRQAPTPEDNARSIVNVCRSIIDLVDGVNGLTMAYGLPNYWDVCEVRDQFTCIVVPWWTNNGMGDRPAGDTVTRQTAYQLAENIATTLERGLSGE